MRNKKQIFKASLIVVLFIFFLVFILQNTQNVEIGFIFARTNQIPLFVVLFITFAIGAFLGYLIGLLSFNKNVNDKK